MSDWNHFFGSMRRYLDYFRSCNQIPSVHGFIPGTQTISEAELAGLLSWTKFATSIAQHDPESRRQMYEERLWNSVETIAGLLSCSIPLVLNGNLYKLLTVLAIDEPAAIHVWNCLLCEGISVQLPSGRLGGIQQDLKEQECVLKVYYCTQGFLHQMKQLFAHKIRPGTAQVAPYLQFIVRSILYQFSARSYVDAKPMWELVKLALDLLDEPLTTFNVTPFTVANKSTEVQILTQLLNDSPMSRSLLQIIIEEGFDRLSDLSPRNAPREDAAFSALRLLHTAVSYRAAMADAIRAVHSDIFISSTASILFTQIPGGKIHRNYLSILLNYVSEIST